MSGKLLSSLVQTKSIELVLAPIAAQVSLACKYFTEFVCFESLFALFDLKLLNGSRCNLYILQIEAVMVLF